MTTSPPVWYEAGMSRSARAPLTARDYWRLPDDGNRWEVIDGETFMTRTPVVAHQRVLLNIAILLCHHVRRRRLGKVFIAPVAVMLDEHTLAGPDLIFVDRAQRAIVRGKAIYGAPALLVEITSPSTAARDRSLKRERYARAGVGCYWMIDPRTDTLRALRLGAGAFDVEAEVGPRARSGQRCSRVSRCACAMS